MRTKVFWTVLIVAFIAFASLSTSPKEILNWAGSQPLLSRLLNNITKQEYFPGPLRGSLDAFSGNLTRDGVISATNDQRSLAGIAPLRMNDKLNRAAKAKLDDMFAQQYFEHESPQGKAPADIITAAGYEYVTVGENLALGNFQNDSALVDAWMNSPGHRANIMHSSFQEIGVAVGQGIFEGKQVWLAVQEFGTPLSSCPQPSAELKIEINNNRAQIDAWQADLEQLKAKIESSNNPQEQQAYRNQYNELAAKTNDLLNRTKDLVDQYNRQVNTFNECLQKNG